MGEQAKNLAVAVGRFVKAAVNGDRLIAGKGLRKKRIQTCKACDQLNGMRCAKCGCSTVAKVALDTEHCPLGKW